MARELGEDTLERIQELEQEEERIVNQGVFSQDDAERQTEINQKLEQLKSAGSVESTMPEPPNDGADGSSMPDDTPDIGLGDDQGSIRERVIVDEDTGQETSVDASTPGQDPTTDFQPDTGTQDSKPNQTEKKSSQPGEENQDQRFTQSQVEDRQQEVVQQQADLAATDPGTKGGQLAQRYRNQAQNIGQRNNMTQEDQQQQEFYSNLADFFEERQDQRFNVDIEDGEAQIEQVAFETEDGEKLTRNEALQRLETQEEELKRVSDLFTQRQQDSQPSFEDQGNPISVEQAAESQKENELIEQRTTSTQELIDQVTTDPLDTTQEQLITGGVSLIKTGQDIGQAGAGILQEEDVFNKQLQRTQNTAAFLNIGTEEQRDQFFSEAQDFLNETDPLPQTGTGRIFGSITETSDVIGSDNVIRDIGGLATTASGRIVTEEQEQGQEAFLTGAGSAGLPLAGLAVSSTGAFPRALEEDTPGVAEGAVKGFELTANQFTGQPGEFIGSEAGEEFAEAAISTAVLGPAGLAVSSVPTPDFTPNVNVDVSGSVKNVASQARERASNFDLPNPRQRRKGQVGVSSDSGTPSFVQDQRTGPETVEVDPVIQEDLIPEFSERTINEDTTPGLEQPVTQSTFNGQTLFGTTSATGAPARPDAVTRAQPGIDEVTGPDVREEFLPQTESTSLGLTRTTTDFLFEQDPRAETQAEPNLERTPSGDFGRPEQDSFFQDEFQQDIVDRGEDTGEFAPSLTAGLFNIQAEENFEEEEFVGTGFDIRPLVDDEN